MEGPLSSSLPFKLRSYLILGLSGGSGQNISMGLGFSVVAQAASVNISPTVRAANAFLIIAFLANAITCDLKHRTLIQSTTYDRLENVLDVQIIAAQRRARTDPNGQFLEI